MHRAAILRCRLIEGSLRRELAVQQGAAVEERLRNDAGRGPEADARREQLIDRQRGAADVARQRDVGQAVGDGDADLGAGGLQIGFGGAHVRALLDELATAG